MTVTSTTPDAEKGCRSWAQPRRVDLTAWLGEAGVPRSRGSVLGHTEKKPVMTITLGYDPFAVLEVDIHS